MQVVEEKEERELRLPLPPSFGYQLNVSLPAGGGGEGGARAACAPAPQLWIPAQREWWRGGRGTTGHAAHEDAAYAEKGEKITLKGLSHEMDLAFDDIYVWLVLG